MQPDKIDELATLIGEDRIKRNEPMKNHTTFRIGGPADCFVTVNAEEELSSAVLFCKKNGIPYYLIGNGSNLLVTDKGIRGCVIRLAADMYPIEICKNGGKVTVKAGAGMLLSAFATEATKNGAAGAEFAAGIPGTVGGAVYMNAGAYGGEIKDILTQVRLMDENGIVFAKRTDEMNLGYRSSILQREKWYVLQAEFCFEEGNPEESFARIEELRRQRMEKQPLEFPSAGSTFKRPEGYFAGKLIQDAGLAGYSVGGAQVSAKHCGFVINAGNATANDVKKLITEVQKTVNEKNGVWLETEVLTLGEEE